MSIIYLETLNIEWGQIDPKHNRRVKEKIEEMVGDENICSRGPTLSLK